MILDINQIILDNFLTVQLKEYKKKIWKKISASKQSLTVPSRFRDAQRSRDRSGQSAAETSPVVAIQRARSIRDATWNGAPVSWQQTYLYRGSHLSDSCPIQSRLLSGGNQVVTFRDKLFETFRVLKPRNFLLFFWNITNNLLNYLFKIINYS